MTYLSKSEIKYNNNYISLRSIKIFIRKIIQNLISVKYLVSLINCKFFSNITYKIIIKINKFIIYDNFMIE